MPHDREHSLDSDNHTGSISDAQHGARGATATHANATIVTDGFISAIDKARLDGMATGATNTPLSITAPVNVTKAAANAGAATEASKQDHKHDVSTAAPAATGVSTASAEGAATSLARSDHSHQSNTAPANVTKAAAVIGTSGEPARADHKHDATTAAPVTLGDANAEGSATSLARSDHVHQWIFGSRFQQSESAGESSYTGSTTYQQKLRLTTPVVPAGTYRISWYFERSADDENDPMKFRAQIDDATDCFEITPVQKDKFADGAYNSSEGFYYAALTNAAHNIDLDYGTSNAGKTVYIRRARLEIWRVS